MQAFSPPSACEGGKPKAEKRGDEGEGLKREGSVSFGRQGEAELAWAPKSQPGLNYTLSALEISSNH